MTRERDFEALTTRMRHCTLCDGLPLGPKPIFQLDERARILIVGQAPGRIAHAKGRPFDDPSGDRLRRWLGVDERRFYTDPRIGIFPMGLCFPGGGPGGDRPPRALCAATWRAPVLGALNQVALTLILGAYAINWHLPHLKKKTVAEAVRLSSAADSDRFVLPHPSPRNNRWLKQNLWFEAEVVPRIQHKARAVLGVSDT